MNCAWCEKATGELVVPGARGAFVHPRSEKVRTAMRFRKKPIVVDAEPESTSKAVCTCFTREIGSVRHVHTPEGVLRVSPCDWIITGTKGEIYPVKPDVFNELYDAVPDRVQGERRKKKTKFLLFVGDRRSGEERRRRD